MIILHLRKGILGNGLEMVSTVWARETWRVCRRAMAVEKQRKEWT